MRINALLNRARYYKRVLLRMERGPQRICTVCGYKGGFRAFGLPPRFDAQCPKCEALERHRLFKFWMDRNSDCLNGLSVLHFAPESCIAELVRPLATTYKSADLMPGYADLELNIESLDLPDSSYNVVICSHVLEHVDDRRALAELHRVLTRGGFAVIMLPLVEGWSTTYENPLAQSPEDRELHFGQRDHVRYFGSDVRDRIQEAGFRLEEFRANGEDSVRYGLTRGEAVFVAVRD